MFNFSALNPYRIHILCHSVDCSNCGATAKSTTFRKYILCLKFIWIRDRYEVDSKIELKHLKVLQSRRVSTFAMSWQSAESYLYAMRIGIFLQSFVESNFHLNKLFVHRLEFMQKFQDDLFETLQMHSINTSCCFLPCRLNCEINTIWRSCHTVDLLSFVPVRARDNIILVKPGKSI